MDFQTWTLRTRRSDNHLTVEFYSLHKLIGEFSFERQTWARALVCDVSCNIVFAASCINGFFRSLTIPALEHSAKIGLELCSSGLVQRHAPETLKTQRNPWSHVEAGFQFSVWQNPISNLNPSCFFSYLCCKPRLFPSPWRFSAAIITASVTNKPSCQNFCYEMELNMDTNFRRGWVLAAMEVITQDRQRGRKTERESVGGCLALVFT
jgi:hypothetical protein